MLLLIGGSFAYFTLTMNATKENIIKSGTLELTLDDTASNGISLSNTVPIADAKGLATDAYTFTLENKGTMGADYMIYLDDIAIDEGKTRMNDKYVKYSLTKNGEDVTTALLTEAGENPNRVLDTGSIAGSTTNTYTLRIWLDYDADNAAMGTVFNAQLIVEAEQNPEATSNFVAAYTYNSTSCVTGEEETCVTTTCYTNSASVSCPKGTIIKYKVNSSTTKYFHVLHDDGATLTMQQRENTVYNTVWYSSANNNNNAYGPTTILPALESATSSWSNVNDQTYTMGTTTLYSNTYTGCSGYNSCSTNTYTLGQRTGKARMITIQETSAMGCTTSNQSCPNWVYNYLYDSTSYGGTANDKTGETNYGYWTMSVIPSGDYDAWVVYWRGYVNNTNVAGADIGARAVVVVNK